jgi:cytochrome c1
MRRRTSLALLAAAAAVAVAGYGALAFKRNLDARTLAASLTGGDPHRGPGLAIRYGCAGCHRVPGVPGPGGLVGPPLAQVGSRVYLAGRLINTPGNLVRWIADPRAVDPGTAMPATGVSEAQARDIAAYLLSRR